LRIVRRGGRIEEASDKSAIRNPQSEIPGSPAPPLPASSAPSLHERKGKKRLALGIMLTLIVTGTILGYSFRDKLRETKIGQALGLTQAKAKDVYYCPMHPDYKSDKPGDCPICNMTLVKLESAAADHDGGHGGADAEKPGGEEMPPGSVMIDPAKQQLIGVTYGEVTSEPVVHTIRAIGRVSYDETKIARIHTKIDGWIEKVYVDFTGKLVKRGDPLISLYSPELVATQQEYLLALKAKEVLGGSRYQEIASSSNSLFEASKKRLMLWDIPEDEIKQIERRGEPMKTLTLYAPTDGFVLTKNAFERQRVTPEIELYAIADLSTVWVLAEIYEYEAPMVRLGQRAMMSLAYFPGETLHGTVDYIYPQVDTMTRTLKVRLQVPNPEVKLKPDMFANIELKIDHGKQLSVPEEAVLDSGAEQIVFVAHEGGYFEPRQVQLGAKVDNRYIVLGGLKPGERIVTSGNFLIDSESRLKSAITAMPGMEHGGGAQPETQDPRPKTQDSKPKTQDHKGH
jgi:RND family efflux transporter MFP subunit